MQGKRHEKGYLLVGYFMRAHFVDVKEVHVVDLGGDMELPDAIDLTTQAVHWLISANNATLLHKTV